LNNGNLFLFDGWLFAAVGVKSRWHCFGGLGVSWPPAQWGKLVHMANKVRGGASNSFVFFLFCFLSFIFASLPACSQL